MTSSGRSKSSTSSDSEAQARTRKGTSQLYDLNRNRIVESKADLSCGAKEDRATTTILIPDYFLAKDRIDIEDDDDSSAGSSSGFNVDSKEAFMSALAASLEGDDSSNSEASPTAEGSSPRSSHLPPRPAASRRRWKTLPANALATIQESDDDGRAGSDLLSSSLTKSSMDNLDGELVLKEVKRKPRQMRVPVVEVENDKDNSMASFLGDLSLPVTNDKKAADDSSLKSDGKHRRIVTDDDQIESAGTAFLDAIGKSMGLNQSKGLGGEEKRVGAAHHRKTRSRCSIDWSDQQVEQLNRARTGVVRERELEWGSP